MKVLLDTSVLVAALVQNHPCHSPAAEWLNQVRQGRIDCVVSAHSVAELYATLSTLQIRPPLSPARAAELIERDILPHVSVRTLTARQYVQLIRRLSAAGLRGGVVYDGIHAEVARRCRVDLLVTLDPHDFQRVWIGDAAQVVSPLEMPPP